MATMSHKHRCNFNNRERGAVRGNLAKGSEGRSRWRSRARRDRYEGSQGEERRQLFSTIVPIYDQINEIMSLGQHWAWKQLCVQYSGARLGSKVLDVCSGSGDVAHLLAKRVSQTGDVTGLDFSAEMLDAARSRIQQGSNEAAIRWIEGDAQQLPFPDSSVDAVTMSYGLRNVHSNLVTKVKDSTIAHGGCKMAVLDFNNSTNAVIDAFQDFALEGVVVPVVSLFGMRDEYAYIRQSIKNFPPGPELERLAGEAGFTQASHYEIANGLMGILVGQK